jgi:hypothetical protein
MEPPVAIDDYSKLSKKLAETHFNWFISQVPSRIDQLKEFTRIGLDFNPDSLIELWKWFINHVEINEKSDEEIERELAGTEWLRNFVSTRKVSLLYQAVALDIAIYFGELIKKNNPKVDWGIIFTPKSFASVNRPVLRGFKIDSMDVIRITSNQVSALLNGEHNSKKLYEIYNVWVTDYL